MVGDQQRLEIGMLVKTNYEERPYRITKIWRDCTCPDYLDTINMRKPPAQPSHIHLELTRPDGSGKFWLGHFEEATLRSLDKTYCGFKDKLDYDYIIILDKQDRQIQTSLF